MNRLLRILSVIAIVGKSRTSIYTAIKDGDFPKPVSIGKRAVAWRAEDIETWVRDRRCKN